MRPTTRRLIAGLSVAAAVALLRPGTRANRVLRRRVDVLARRLRHLAGHMEGASYRLRGRRPNPDAADSVLTDRIRSSIGPLEKRLDLPHIHVMVEDHVALLHGVVGSDKDAHELEAAVADVSGVVGVESYLHVGLAAGDTRPSAARSFEQPSDVARSLRDAATSAGLDPSVAEPVVRAILAAFAERLPSGERDHVAAHLPADARAMFTPPRRIRTRDASRIRTVPELVVRICAACPELPSDKARPVVAAVVRELRALVPEETFDIAAVLPADLREFWERPPN